jgi:MoxR-like ATPase
MDLTETSRLLRDDIERIRGAFGKTIIGNRPILDAILKALFSNGHILIEGLPGLGKTLMVKTVARLLHLHFSRVQFTPDLMPADIVGVNIIVDDDSGHRHFRFERGPVFTNILLADEINRASPKTQSALLQVMEEREITVFGQTHPMEAVFLTMATQNPIELKGTYPLPEAQLDRFMFKLNIDYPAIGELREIARLNLDDSVSVTPEPILDGPRIREIKAFIRRIPVSEEIYAFASDLVYRTHPEVDGAAAAARKYVQYGSSPRGLIALLAAARVTAAFDGRFNLSHTDIEENYLPALRHRLILNFEAQVEKVGPDDILAEIYGGLGKPR